MDVTGVQTMDAEVDILPHLRLQIALKHPNVEDCWSEGYECSQEDGLDESSNPYKDGSIENEQWREGWWAGFYGEEPLYEVSVAPQEAPEVQVRQSPQKK